MANKTTVDPVIFGQAQDHASQLVSQFGARDTDFETYEAQYLLDWVDKPKIDGVKVTISPDSRNAVLGATRLMTSTDPQFRVPDDYEMDDDQADRIESAVTRMWSVAGRIAQSPIHYDAVLSGFLYGEIHIAISSTASILELVKGAGASKSGIARAEKVASMTPYLFEVWNPKAGYPEFDALGLSAYYRKVSVNVSDVRGRYGSSADMAISGRKSSDKVILSIFYDLDNYAVWLDGVPIIAEPHELPIIPVAVTITEGSRMFDNPEQQRQPMLYAASKSGLWDRENLSLTVLYTNMFNIGVNPTFIHTTPQGKPEKQLIFDTSIPGGVIDLEYGESLLPMATKGIIDPSFSAGLDIAERKLMESTLYRQALGEPLQGSPAFSTVSLLSQSGRLPLIRVQKLAGWGIGNAVEIALYWWKDSKPKVDGYEMKVADIPDNPRMEVKLDVDLPQDKLQMANIAQMLTSGANPLVSNEWVLREFFNVEQAQQMSEDILTEQASIGMAKQYIGMRLQQMAMQQQQQTQQAGPQPGPGMPPGSMPAGPGMPQQGQGMPMLPPELMAQMQQGGGPMIPPGVGGQGFDTGMGGLPPAAAGMIPPGEGMQA